MASVRQAVSATLRAARDAALARESRARFAASAGALVLSASLSWAPHAYAANADAAQAAATSNPPATATGDQLQEITVTGSRIKRTTDFTTATPTTVIDTEAMQNAGVVNVGDVLAMTPSNISNFTPTTTGTSSFNTGAYVADLGGLNPFFGSRTLTLIDNQRAVSTSSMDSFDLNFVPQVLVQRIDTITGGGSALYGSGAVGGVVNIVLDHQLEGGKLDYDTYDTHYNDNRTNHVAAAYGFGIADNRVHVVIGGEYQKSDPAWCQTSGRAWCSANYGPYTTGPALVNGAPSFFANVSAVGAGLTTNTSPYGLLGTAAPNQFFTAYTLNSLGALYAGSPDGLGLTPFDSNNGYQGGTAPGGSGEPVNIYQNLVTGVTRGVITGMVTAKITDDITMHTDINWGKVEAVNPSFASATGVLGTDNPFLGAVGGAAWETGGSAYAGGAPAAYFAKDFSSQIPNSQYSNTTLKQISVSFDGKIGQSSWTWDARGLYGKTENEQGSPHSFSLLGSSMALDVAANGTCRVSAGLAAAAQSAGAAYGGGGIGGYAYPVYLQVYNALQTTGSNPYNPVSGLYESQTLAYLAQKNGSCQPLNPFGNQPLSAAAVNYATQSLGLTLEQNMTAFSLDTSGEIWKGIGAGPFSLAAGYEWHKEVTYNDFSSCPGARNTLGNAGLTTEESDCLAAATDLAAQYGNDYGGSTIMNEVYAELNFPLLKNAFLARKLELDVAGRDSFYTNKALYGVDVVPNTEGTGSLPTWKASLVWEPVEGIRFRGSQSHDSRDPDPRDLYYSQSFVPGNTFFNAGWCAAPGGAPLGSPPGTPAQQSLCAQNLLGNVNLKPEQANTTTLGLVFTPPQVPGLQASADWFHVRITDGIEGAGLNGITNCWNALGRGGAAAFSSNQFCNHLTFNNLYYDPTTYAAVAKGTPGAITGAQAFETGYIGNVTGVDTLAYNGGSIEERGVDFSVSYGVALPGGSTLTARALATWTGQEDVVDQPGNPAVSVLNQTGVTSTLLQNYQSAARWRGNLYLTWSVGNFNLSPNMSWVGQGLIGSNAISCSAADFNNTASLCNFAASGGTFFPPPPTASAAAKAQYAYYSAASTIAPLTILPQGVSNHVPAYFLFGLNASYTLNNIPGLKSLTLWGQVNNLLNKAPPFTNSTIGSPAFYDMMGQAYRVGFRMTF